MFASSWIVAGLLLVTAQETPPAGTAPAPLKVSAKIPGPFFPYNLNGPRETSYACPITAIEDNPCVLVFLKAGDEGTDPVRKFLTELDTAMVRYRRDNLRSFVTIIDPAIKGSILTEDDARNDAAKKLKEWIGGLMTKSINFGLDSREGIKEWSINPEAALTVVLYKNYRVTGIHSLTTADLTDAKLTGIFNDIVEKKMVQPRRTNPIPAPRP